MQHHFNTFIAKKYSIETAIFVDNFVFWTNTNASKEKNFHDGRYWSYGTPEFFTKYFTYISARRIRTILGNCVRDGVLIKGDFNKKAYDRTNWYSLSDLILYDLNLDITCSKPRITQAQTDLTKIADPSDQNRSTIPNTKPDTKKNNLLSHLEKKPKEAKQEEIKLFEEIRLAYNELMPELPRSRVIGGKLETNIRGMVTDWGKYQKEHKTFTIELFKNYLNFLRSTKPWVLNKYPTDKSNPNSRRVHNTLKNLTGKEFLLNMVNGVYND